MEQVPANTVIDILSERLKEEMKSNAILQAKIIAMQEAMEARETEGKEEKK